MSVGDIKGGVVRRVEHFQALLIRNKMAKPASGGVRGGSSLCLEPPPPPPAHSPRMAPTPSRGRTL